MRHIWILAVLRDLRTYADLNELPAIAAAAAQTLEIAETEISTAQGDSADAIRGGLAMD